MIDHNREIERYANERYGQLSYRRNFLWLFERYILTISFNLFPTERDLKWIISRIERDSIHSFSRQDKYEQGDSRELEKLGRQQIIAWPKKPRPKLTKRKKKNSTFRQNNDVPLLTESIGMDVTINCIH